MTQPHPGLIALAAERPLPEVPRTQFDDLAASAFEHKMAGLLWSRVAAGELKLPKSTTMVLARADLRTRGHHLRLWQTATDIAQRLRARGIGVAVAKGVSIEARWYERLGERPSVDVDLVIEPGKASLLDEIIFALQPDRVLHGRAVTLLSTGMLQSVDIDVAGIDVDLHADIMKYEIPTRSADVIWQRLRKVSGPNGATVDALDPELSLVHSLLHLNKDRFSLLLGYADVARILARENLDWDFIDAFLRREGLAVHIYSALDVVVTTLGLEHQVPRRPRSLRATFWDLLWSPNVRLAGREGYTTGVHRQFFIPMLADGRSLEAVRWFVRRRIAPPASLIDLYYPNTSGPYLLRLLNGRLQVMTRNRVARQAYSRSNHFR